MRTLDKTCHIKSMVAPGTPHVVLVGCNQIEKTYEFSMPVIALAVTAPYDPDPETDWDEIDVVVAFEDGVTLLRRHAFQDTVVMTVVEAEEYRPFFGSLGVV